MDSARESVMPAGAVGLDRGTPRISWRTALFALLVISAVVGLVLYERAENRFLGFVDAVIYAFLACVALAAIGSTLGQSARSYGRALFVVTVGVAAIWYLPAGPREVFADTAARIEVGMDTGAVDEVMAGYAASFIPKLPWQKGATNTYYEPAGEQHRFDCFCLVTWEEKRVVAARFYMR